MNESEFKVLSRQLQSVQDGMNRIDKDLAQDREDLRSFAIEVANLKAEVAQLRKLISRQPDKIQDKVAEAVEPMINEAHDLKETINKKKTLVITEKIRPLWKKLLRRR